MNQLKPRMDILPDAQQALWPRLAPTVGMGLVLYGGTAIALQLGHRCSVDFDFFTEKPLDRKDLYLKLPFLRNSITIQDEENSLSVLVPREKGSDEHVKVSFFGTIDNGRVGAPLLTEDGVLKVASLDDLMATKSKVILQRVEAKDYQDIAAMLRAGVNLEKALSAARLMYGMSFQPSESLKAMTYFEGGDLHNLTKEEKAILTSSVAKIASLPVVTLKGTSLSDEVPTGSGEDLTGKLEKTLSNKPKKDFGLG